MGWVLAAPLRQAEVRAFNLPGSYYGKEEADYQQPRDLWLGLFERAGFRCFRPDGAYYIMTDIRDFGSPYDYSFVRPMIEHAGVAAVPGSIFFENSNSGATLIRFCFCKKYETLEKAGNRLSKL